MAHILVLFNRQFCSPCEILRHTRDDPALKAACELLDQLIDRVDELEAQLTEYKRFAGSEFADVRGRVGLDTRIVARHHDQQGS